MICLVWGGGMLEGIFPTRMDALRYLVDLSKGNEFNAQKNSIRVSFPDGAKTFHFLDWNCDTQYRIDITPELIDDFNISMKVGKT